MFSWMCAANDNIIAPKMVRHLKHNAHTHKKKTRMTSNERNNLLKKSKKKNNKRCNGRVSNHPSFHQYYFVHELIHFTCLLALTLLSRWSVHSIILKFNIFVRLCRLHSLCFILVTTSSKKKKKKIIMESFVFYLFVCC